MSIHGHDQANTSEAYTESVERMKFAEMGASKLAPMDWQVFLMDDSTHEDYPKNFPGLLTGKRSNVNTKYRVRGAVNPKKENWADSWS